ncbi:hypothetical protein [Thomasclavelia cocleata]|uniref:hypothetical protein n=1 Tax=Thomasclavelia cocleata TaxID=69824 RepID=UPI002432AFC9|nr:hypothetical protein [Thomasclavelia cocleata]
MITVVRSKVSRSFILFDKETNNFGINISPNDDMIKVFSWLYNELPIMKNNKINNHLILSMYNG